MSNLDSLEEIAALGDIRVSVGERIRRTDGGRVGFRGISANIMRAKPARERPKPEKPAKAVEKPVAVAAPVRPQTNVAFARVISDYSALVDTLSERCEEMEIARLELDRIAGLTNGHSGKLLSKQPRRHFGIASLGPILQSLGLILLAVEDPAARAKTLACRTPFDASNRRLGNQCNPKKESST